MHLTRLPPEKIVRIDVLTTAFSRDRLKGMRRVVELACGHAAITKAVYRARCARCEEMLRRSLDGGQEDYDAFRRHGAADRMVWREDPARRLNEPTDLEGNFVNP